MLFASRKGAIIYRLIGKIIILLVVIAVVLVVIVDAYAPNKFPIMDEVINSRIGRFGIGCGCLCVSRYYFGLWFSYEDGVIMRALSFFTAPTLFAWGVIHFYMAAFGA